MKKNDVLLWGRRAPQTSDGKNVGLARPAYRPQAPANAALFFVDHYSLTGTVKEPQN